METPGQCLKRKRQERGLSLEDVSGATKISRVYLQAIEEDRYEVLPAEVFAVGFLKQYAACVGLDPDDVVLRYRVARKQGETVRSGQPRARARLRARQAAVGLLCLLFAVAALWSLFSPRGDGGSQKVRAIRTHRASPRELRKAQIRQELGLDRVAPALGARPEGFLHGWAAEKAMPAEPDRKRVNVVVQSARENWLSVEMDGGPWVDRTLEPGEPCAFSASRSLRLRIGHGDGVKVFYDGKVLENLGEKGDIIHMSFPPTAPGWEESAGPASPGEE